MNVNVREPAVAGLFYPADPGELRAMIAGFLRDVPVRDSPPKALVVPHGGYLYSGAVAARAYAQLAPLRYSVKRVVLLGPSHRIALRGLAVTSAEIFTTPLGAVPVDREAVGELLTLPQVGYQDAAHELEHSLEVHLPFLQTLLTRFSLIPLVVGEASPEIVAEVLDRLWGGGETLVVISTDLSHYQDHISARLQDRNTSTAIKDLDFRQIREHDACGRNPLNGLLYLARAKGLTATCLDLATSGDTAGPRDRVVGFGAYTLSEPRH